MRTGKWSMSIRAKLALQAGGVVFGMAVLAYAAYATLERVKVTGPIYVSIIRDKDLLADILPPPAYIIESYLVANRMIAESDATKIEELIGTFAELRKVYGERHAYWQNELPSGPSKDKLLQASYTPAVAFFEAYDREFLPALKAGKRDEARRVLEEVLTPAYATHRAAIDETVKLATDSAAQTEKNAIGTIRTSTMTMLGIAGIAGVMGGIGCFLVGGSIVRRIPALTKFAQSLADGDLTARLGFDSNDEFGRLGQSLDDAASSMSQVVGQVAASSTEVAGAATQIAAAAEEMSASVGEVARQASSASESAGRSGEMAASGGEVVSKTVVEMKQISDAVNRTAASIASLGKRGDEIGKVIAVINDIADQTNLLALNAAIEAARAGEHGRGFAVVADEVRKLAERTTKATEEVATSIKAIQNETKMAVERMNQGTEQVKVGVQLAEQAGSNLGTIVEGANQVASLIQSISSASEEAGAATSESAQAAQELSNKAEQLRQLVGRFRTDAPASAPSRASTKSPPPEAAKQWIRQSAGVAPD